QAEGGAAANARAPFVVHLRSVAHSDDLFVLQIDLVLTRIARSQIHPPVSELVVPALSYLRADFLGRWAVGAATNYARRHGDRDQARFQLTRDSAHEHCTLP